METDFDQQLIDLIETKIGDKNSCIYNRAKLLELAKTLKEDNLTLNIESKAENINACMIPKHTLKKKREKDEAIDSLIEKMNTINCKLDKNSEKVGNESEEESEEESGKESEDDYYGGSSKKNYQDYNDYY